MALVNSGPISLGDVRGELGESGAVSLGGGSVRGLAGIGSGAITLSSLYGKAAEVRFVNSSNRTAASIFDLMGSPSQAGTYVFENQAIISAGSSSYALRTGGFPAGSTLKIINKGTIQGKGGNGGSYNRSGGGGSNALHIDFDCTLDNETGYIFGGGGGGGGGWSRNSDATQYYIRTGGGGGAGISGGSGGSPTTKNLGPSASSSYVRTAASGSSASGGVGGRIRASNSNGWSQVTGGSGGSMGSSGGSASYTGGGAHIKSQRWLYGGGGAGKAINKNGNSVTIISGNDSTHIKGSVA